ncbi:MAG TPA: phospho-N-acetylmuramoyl-pentapeptide-transferase [Candidatus Coproplasma excrementavium]|nr:phospho-N-acetylmuramoyl-pentapeptide-transferase [Candidatus Coproplasma excrementavium]
MKMAYAATLAAFFISLALLLAITPLLRRLKAGQYILGYVKEHKNKSGTPTMGGLAFVCAATIVSLCFCGVNSTTVNLTLVITAGYCLIGFADDFLKIYRKENLGLRPYQKIIFQCAIAAIAAAYCYVNKLTLLNIPFTHITVDISWGIIPLAVFVFLSAVNCVNLTDGLDGLAGGTSLAYLAAFGVMLIGSGSDLGTVSLAMCGALGAFLLFNTNRASVFMGDTGSLALGALISCVSVFSRNALYIPVIGIMFVISGISVIIQVIYYKRTRRRIFLMAPVHHHFQMKGFAESKISYAYFAVTAVAGLLCLAFA